MWILIYWICGSTCVTQQVQGFSELEFCKAAAMEMVDRNSLAKSPKIDAVCVNADMNMFE